MSSTDTEVLQDELAALKVRADRLNIDYHPSIGVAKLREKVAAAMSDEAPVVAEVATTVAVSAAESEGQRRKRLKNEASELIRIRLSCMNPAKKEWEGEIITVGNAVTGTLKKFVPFNAEEGWHVPRFMYEVLKARECQVFYTFVASNGQKTRKGKLMKEFAIEVLPMLTESELHDLAQRQAMAKSID